MSKNAATTVSAPTRSQMSTRELTICALLCALNVIFGRFFTAMPSAVARFSIEAVPIVLAGYFFGPVAGMLVGFVGDTVGCLFTPYGWDPLISVSPMLVGLFAGLLRPLAYKLEKPWDIWKVGVTILPGKVLGSIYWTSQCLVWLGYSKKGLGVLMGARTVEAGLEWVLETLVVFVLLKTGVFRRARVFPPEKREEKRSAATTLRYASAGLLILQVLVFIVGSLTVGLGFLNGELTLAARIGSGAAYLIPTLGAIVCLVVSNHRADRRQK